MCIRDRAGTLMGQESMISRIDMCAKALLLNGKVRNIAAVSYTHLRAHETVLDLVCRLLLEKKKNKNYEITKTIYMLPCAT